MRSMNHRSAMTIALLLSLAVSAPTLAQLAEPFEPDPAAVKAFAQVLEAYRARPALRVQSALEIELIQGETVGGGEKVTAELTYSKGGAGVVRIREFTCHFADGEFFAVHERTDDAYLREEYEGTPYWTLLYSFQDLPYPHLALFWGEDAASDVYMQLVPSTPLIVPTEVGEEKRGDRTLRRIVLSSPNGSLRLLVDPKTKLIESAVHEITGGMYVQPGTTKRTTYTFKYTTFDKPIPAAELAFKPGDRKRVDLMASLLPPPEPPAGGGGGPGGAPVALVGKPAPEFVLATADGGAVDLDDLRGEVVVLDFWATWCGPCARALPKLHDVASWARDRALPVTVLTVNTFEGAALPNDTPDARLESVLAFWKARGFTLPIVMDYTDETAQAYGVTGIPATIVIRADGIVHAQHTGAGADYAETLREEIAEAIEAVEAPAEGAG
jgi:thiol-disulfide isomerase/thioredoxin